MTTGGLGHDIPAGGLDAFSTSSRNLGRACWRVPVRIYRRDAEGRPVVVVRPGPIIAAADAEAARDRAHDICRDWPDFAGLDAPVFQHNGHRGVTVGSLLTPTAPVHADDLTLLRMIRAIRERSRLAKAEQRRRRAAA